MSLVGRLCKKKVVLVYALCFLFIFIRIHLNSNTVKTLSAEKAGEENDRFALPRENINATLTFKKHEFIEEPKLDYSEIFHSYQEHVDLRVIILTYNRPDSLRQVLNSLQDLQLDGDLASMEIWIDRSKEGKVDEETLQVAREFRWEQGPVRLHVHSKHAGLYGQWINSWRPKPYNETSESKTELALFVEDDIDVSKYAYRWLRASFNFYKTRSDIGVFGLQDENAVISRGKSSNKELTRPKGDLVFLYQLPSSWGSSPHPGWWRRFQDWYVSVSKDPNFKPYVPAASMHTSWYRIFEKQKRQDTMWTIWLIKFTNDKKLFTTYSNLPTFTNKSDVSFISNRKVDGLHFNPNMRSHWTVPKLMTEWDDKYIDFSHDVKKFAYDGSKI